MGTINYGTSEIITIGQLMFNGSGLSEEEWEEERTFYMDETEDLMLDIQKLINDHDFEFYKIVPEHGYYEGMYINIKLNTCCYYGGPNRNYKEYNYVESSEERKNILKELTQIKNMLLECVNYHNLNVIYPGWCTTELNYEDSIKEINKRIAEEKKKIRSFPTWKQLCKQENILV